MTITCCSPAAQYVAHKKEIDAAMRRVLSNGRFVLGPEVAAFEKEFARYIGVKFAVGVASGTDALVLALKAYGVGRGDEVITVSHTAAATVAAIKLVGAMPVFLDISPSDFTMDPSLLKRAITPRTKAIIPVHLYGQPANMAAISQAAKAGGIKIIEDCAQAHGATYGKKRVGSLGNAGCFSFYPTKNLSAIGDGGMVVTNDKRLEQRLRQLREYGWIERYVSRIDGMNSRLDELQAAILRVKLKYLDRDNRARARIAARYQEGFAGADLVLPAARKGTTHAYHQFVVLSARRDALRAYLRKKGIETLIHYPMPVHQQPAYRGGAIKLPVTDFLKSRILSLPIYPELAPRAVNAVIRAIRRFEGR